MVVQPGTTVDKEDTGAPVAPALIKYDHAVEDRPAVGVLKVPRRERHRVAPVFST
jgi:hypothetical protein